MPKLIAALNMSFDGDCDHTAGLPDEEIHNHYTNLLNNAGAILYGRTTYQLMEDYWPTLIKNPSGKKSMDDFAAAIDNVPKIVFSRTLNNVTWRNTTLKKEIIKEDILALKAKPGKDIYAGSPSMIVSLMRLGLIDEYQICVHPVITGGGLPLFKNIGEKVLLKLIKTKTFGSGAVLHYYQPKNEK